MIDSNPADFALFGARPVCLIISDIFSDHNLIGRDVQELQMKAVHLQRHAGLTAIDDLFRKVDVVSYVLRSCRQRLPWYQQAQYT